MPPDLHRQANTVAVLRALTGHGPSSVAALRAMTGLSRPTLDAIVGELSAERMIIQDDSAGGRSGAGSGRPARQFAVNADAGYVAGVDVGRHKIVACVADLTGAVRVERRVEVAAASDGAELVASVQRTVSEAVAAVPLSVGQLHGIALGVPGAVDAAGRITRSVVIPQWSGYDVGRVLADWARVPISINNDANLAALAEQWRGAARLCQDVVYILAGRRTRAAIMINQTVLTGRHGEAGEVGSVPELFFDTPQVLLGDPTADSERVAGVFTAARGGDPHSMDRVQVFCRELARTLRFLITVLDPELVVIGGGLAAAGDQIITGIRDHLRTSELRTPLVASTLGDGAVALGGVRQAQLIAAQDDPLIGAIAEAAAENFTADKSTVDTAEAASR